MIEVREKDGAVIFSVRVIPRSAKSVIVGEHAGALKIKLAAPPVDGAANEELIRLLAGQFGVAKSAVTILSGHGAKAKQVSITGAPQENLTAILQA